MHQGSGEPRFFERHAPTAEISHGVDDASEPMAVVIIKPAHGYKQPFVSASASKTAGAGFSGSKAASAGARIPS